MGQDQSPVRGGPVSRLRTIRVFGVMLVQGYRSISRHLPLEPYVCELAHRLVREGPQVGGPSSNSSVVVDPTYPVWQRFSVFCFSFQI